MREYPNVPTPSMGAIIEWVRSICVLRREDAKEIRNLDSRLVRGRLRTDRTVPAAFNDVEAGIDKEGDIVRAATFEYTLINDAGTLKWARSALNVAW